MENTSKTESVLDNYRNKVTSLRTEFERAIPEGEGKNSSRLPKCDQIYGSLADWFTLDASLHKKAFVRS